MPIASIVSLAYNLIYCALAYIIPGYQTFKVREAPGKGRPALSVRASQAPQLHSSHINSLVATHSSDLGAVLVHCIAGVCRCSSRQALARMQAQCRRCLLRKHATDSPA